MIKEQWRPIPGFEEYQVSDQGRVKNKFGHILSPNISNKGYYLVTLSNGYIKKTCSVHRLVAMAWISNPLNLPQVNHKNFIRTDNRVENLEWISNRGNVVYSFDRGCAMLDDDGNIVLTADCARQMAEKTGIPQTGIKHCLNHKYKKTHGKRFVLLKEYLP